MLKIGITGGIGSGKTTVCKVFELLGTPVFYADEVAKQLMVGDEELMQQIRAEFGEQAYLEGNILNRQHLSAIVFKQADKLEKLNALVHPAVFKEMDRWAAEQDSPYVLKEAALLFESGSYQDNDFNILVSAPEPIKIERVMKRDGISKEKVMDRMRNQMSEEEKIAKADFLIKNDESEFLITQVLKLHQQFVK